MRRVVILLVLSASLAAVSAAGASGVRTCGYIHASVPYSAHGQAYRWRVYVDGSASCTTAVAVLDAVMHLRATPHLGSAEADSYFPYTGWLSRFGARGLQTCDLPPRLPAHPPIRAHALARSCAASPGSPGGCPAR